MWFAIDVAHGDLAFGIRAQKRQTTVFAQLGLAFDQAVGVVNRGGHQLRRFVAGVAKHQTLVAGTGVEVIVGGMVHPLGNVVALLVIGHQYGAAFVVDTVVSVVVANALERVTRDLDVIDVGLGRDFTSQHHQPGVAQGFSSHA
ncbi:hypothetical protein GALL_544700 [mine drainage metagenome]|uniref:Uncharacterized protein n=1 Tax=mine drainage metagenome TaxID=410659 RepID=A0A1J5P855_9ZZZZ